MEGRRARTRDEVIAHWHVRELGDGLRLAPLGAQHVERFVELVERNREQVGAWASWVWQPFGVDEACAEVERLAPGERGPWSLPFAIERDEVMIGFVHLFMVRFVLSIGVVGYWIDHDEAGRGTTTRAVDSLCRLTFDELGLHRVELRCATDNAASLAVARKAGFVVEGVQRDAWRVRDQVQSVVMHSRLEDDPRPR